MFNKDFHLSINQQIFVFKDKFPPEILKIIEYYVIKFDRYLLQKYICRSANKFKYIRDNLQKYYISTKISNSRIEYINYLSMHKEMIKKGINPNNPEYIPLYRQRAIQKLEPLWWTR